MKKSIPGWVVVLIMALCFCAVYVPKENRFIMVCASSKNIKELKAYDDEEFLKDYVNMYGAESLFDNYIKIYNDDTDIDKNEFLHKILKVTGIKEIKFDDSKVEKGDFYIKNPDAEPQDNSRTDSYRRSTSADSDVFKYSDNITYYGDFAILEEKSTYYNPGRYEWSNGKFYDIPASTSHSKHYSLYYKGIEIKTLARENDFEDITNANPTIYELNEEYIIAKTTFWAEECRFTKMK